MFSVMYYIANKSMHHKLAKAMKDSHAQDVLSFFHSIADKYDFVNAILSFGLFYLWKRRTIARAGLKKGEKVIDVCGGTGALSAPAAHAVGYDGLVVLYDFCSDMICAGAAKRRHRGHCAAIRCVCGDALHLAVRSNTFDAALIGFGLRNLSDMEQGVSEILRVLKPGGRMVCLEFSHPLWSWFRRLYDWYSFHIIPLAGSLLTGSRAAYEYLPRSIRVFPEAEQLAQLLRSRGFCSVSYRLFCNGIAAVHIGTKSGGGSQAAPGQGVPDTHGRFGSDVKTQGNASNMKGRTYGGCA